MSLQDLPQSILRIVVGYIADPHTLCHLDSTCLDLHAVVREEALWKLKLQERWTLGNRSNESMLARIEYARRHMVDNGVIQCVNRLTTTTQQLPMLYSFTFVMAFGQDAMDICWKIWREHKHKETRNFARGLLRLLNCQAVCAGMIHVLTDEYQSDLSPGERLEEACILTACMFRELQPASLVDTTGNFVKEQLQAVADEIQNGITEQMSIHSKLMRVHDVFFHSETGFSSNTSNYYDYRNSLVNISLDRRKAIPMTLALLYKFVCRRVGILVEVVGLPGHIVAHVPALDTFVDVFDGGRLLTTADCARIVAGFGFPFQASYLNPLPPELIVQRILNNLENCLVRQPTVQTPMAARQRAAISALRIITVDPREDQIEETGQSQVLTWVTEACVGTDIADW